MKNHFPKFFLLTFCFVILSTGGLLLAKKTKSEDIEDEYEQTIELNADATDFPKVEFTVLPAQLIQPGQEVQLLANPLFFAQDTGNEKIHFNWCIDNLPMASKVAGSDDKIQGSEGNYYLENRYGRLSGGQGVCSLYELVNDPNYQKIEDKNRGYDLKMSAPKDFYLKRQPNKDSDHDGLDDDWEVKYFAGRRMPQTNQYFVGADEKDALLKMVTPTGDFDNDGWEFPYTDAHGEWEETTFIGIAAQVIKHSEYSMFKSPWMMGVPYAKDNITGDNKFTNFEEYTFGTDPLESDTDSDGINDEADVAGLTQKILTLRINKNEGDVYDVVLYAFGVTQRWQMDRDNSKRQWEKYFRADFPNRRTDDDYNDYKGLAVSTEGANRFQVKSGLPKQIQAGYSPYPAYRGGEIEVKTEVVALSEKKENYTFNWFRNGKQDDNEKNQSGLNKNVYKFKPDNPALCQEVIGVEVIDETTKKMDYQEIEIPLGLDFQFTKEILGNVSFGAKNEEISDFNSKQITSSDPKYLNHQELFFGNDPYLAEVNKNNLGFRKGDLIKVGIEGLRNNYNSSCYNDLSFEEFENNLSYNWQVNGIKLKGRSGRGKNFSEIKYILTGEPRIEVKNPESSDSVLQQGQEAFNLEVEDNGGNIIARTTEQLQVIPPYIEFAVEGAEKKSSQCEGCEGSGAFYQASEGKKMKVNAHLYNFRPSRDRFEYIWTRNNKEVAREKVVTNQATYEFKVGYDENGEKNNVSKEEISLKVVNKVNSEDFDVTELEEGENNITVEIAERAKEATSSSVGGALGKLVPSYYKNLFNIVFIPTVILLLAIFGVEFAKVKKRE
ncbi:MAG: hypothetical protein AB1465_02610 [Patescibacteria group bacterium]